MSRRYVHTAPSSSDMGRRHKEQQDKQPPPFAPYIARVGRAPNSEDPLGALVGAPPPLNSPVTSSVREAREIPAGPGWLLAE